MKQRFELTLNAKALGSIHTSPACELGSREIRPTVVLHVHSDFGNRESVELTNRCERYASGVIVTTVRHGAIGINASVNHVEAEAC